jgi:hypothetical protein
MVKFATYAKYGAYAVGICALSSLAATTVPAWGPIVVSLFVYEGISHRQSMREDEKWRAIHVSGPVPAAYGPENNPNQTPGP